MIKYHLNNDPNQKMQGIYDLPTEDKRLLDQEIKGEEEYNQEQGIEFETPGVPNLAEGQNPLEERQANQHQFNHQEGRQKKSNTGNLQVPGSEAFEDDDGENAIRQSEMVAFRTANNVRLEDFQKKALLGKGTFGKVFLAELRGDTSGKQWAIKAIRKDVLLDFKQVQNTKLEKDILFSCDHPFLVGMEYLFQTPQRLYFVMPFVRGGELYKIFKAHKRLPEQVVKFYSLQICLAIGYLHSKGIMHRDLKLENILLDESGYLKIIDYGLAKTM